jgi:hypothetical protein
MLSGSARETRNAHESVPPRPDAAAQLMQLGQPVAIGVEYDDAAGLRNVHADLDHRGGHKHGRFPPAVKSAMTCALVASSSRPVSVAKAMPSN